MSEPLLSVRDLRVVFQMATGEIEALHGVDFDIQPGSTVALVGESGSGKSVTAQAVMGILPANARITSGQLIFNDPLSGASTDIASLPADSSQLQDIRGGRISIIFQEPMVSLSPLHTVEQVSEALFLHHDVNRAQGMEQTEAMLEMVGFSQSLPGPYAPTLSSCREGCQRAMIAMALVSLLIADEPTTALDVTVQAQILNLIRDLQAELKMALLLITHDLGVVANMAQTVVVMYHGRIVESGTAVDLFKDPVIRT